MARVHTTVALTFIGYVLNSCCLPLERQILGNTSAKLKFVFNLKRRKQLH